MKRLWTAEEADFLKENWGVFHTDSIAAHLNRTNESVRRKAVRLKLGPIFTSQGKLTATALGDLIGVKSDTVIYWINNHGLKAIKRSTVNGFSYYQIGIDTFWKWAKEHQKNVDSRRFEPLALGIEPEWMKEKRKLDALLPAKHIKNWTPQETDRLKFLLKTNRYTYKEISVIVGRSFYAVKRKVCRLQW